MLTGLQTTGPRDITTAWVALSGKSHVRHLSFTSMKRQIYRVDNNINKEKIIMWLVKCAADLIYDRFSIYNKQFFVMYLMYLWDVCTRI